LSNERPSRFPAASDAVRSAELDPSGVRDTGTSRAYDRAALLTGGPDRTAKPPRTDRYVMGRFDLHDVRGTFRRRLQVLREFYVAELAKGSV
jgi:hypothetical protein